MKPFRFGIYPGGISGTDQGLSGSKPDDFSKIAHALDLLQGNQQHFYVRLYMQYIGLGKVEENNFQAYLDKNRKVNLVLQYQADHYDENDWIRVIHSVLGKYASYLQSVQITEEANLYHIPIIDGCKPHVRTALVTGVVEAKKYIVENNLNIAVGFNAVPNFNPKDDFWESVYQIGGANFIDATDYVGLDFFPDVFRGVADDGQPGDLVSSVRYILDKFRHDDLPKANIPVSVPIYITENGWPTGMHRSYERQSQVLETIIRTLYDHRLNYNVTQYLLFSLRDSDSSVEDIYHQFGILKDDYSPKPAFYKYAKLIAGFTT